jgi:hypothetical protein
MYLGLDRGQWGGFELQTSVEVAQLYRPRCGVGAPSQLTMPHRIGPINTVNSIKTKEASQVTDPLQLSKG